jgi:hypothetical protein
MRSFCLIVLAGIVLVASCHDGRKPNEANLRKAIDLYLKRQGKTCALIGRQFPVDVPESVQKDQYGIGPQMEALERAGLVHSYDAVAPAGVLGDAGKRAVKRYEITGEGERYFQETPGIFGQTASFCYGQKTVDSIVQWTEPVTTSGSLQVTITYTYKIAHLRHCERNRRK